MGCTPSVPVTVAAPLAEPPLIGMQQSLTHLWVYLLWHVKVSAASPVHTVLCVKVGAEVGAECCFRQLIFQCIHTCHLLCVCVWLLTLNWQGDGLAGLVLSILVINRLDVVAAGVGCHRREDNQRVVQRDGTEGGGGGTARQEEYFYFSILRYFVWRKTSKIRFRLGFLLSTTVSTIKSR